MRDLLEGLGPSRNVARRMHELEAELRQARTQLRRHNKSPETLGRWGLDAPVPAQQEEGWFITYLDMMTLLLVVMIVMLAFSGSIGGLKRNDAQAAGSSAQVVAAQVDGASAGPARTAGAAQPVEAVEKTDGGAGLLPGGLGFLPGKSALGDTQTIPGHAAATLAADVGPLPADATVLPSIQAAVSLAELYPGWAAEDLTASFVGPPRPEELRGPQLASSRGTMAAVGPTEAHALTSGMNTVPMIGTGAATVDAVTDGAGDADASGGDDLPTEGENLAAGLALAQLGNDVEVVVNERSVSFRVNSEILFDSSQADLSRPGLSVLRKIITVLADTDHNVTVEGHTDAVPVRRNVRYPSNWELSSSRAGSVVRYLQANGIDKTRLKAIGYADARPIDDNNTPEGRARNRRVELIIEKHD